MSFAILLHNFVDIAKVFGLTLWIWIPAMLQVSRSSESPCTRVYYWLIDGCGQQ